MSQRLVTAVIIALCLVNFSLEENAPIVNTDLGKVRGYYRFSYNGREFAAFEGIPYAKPPIASLRFEKPIEIEPWSGIWIANILHVCMQIEKKTFRPFGSEDCLYLNVYVPKAKLHNKSNLQDVIVHIHGGAFIRGDPTMAGPEYLMDRNIVYVNINYRLGALGFLSTQDNVVPGNMGLKDQVMALQWIQKHIRHFGGNPDSVTIIGFSAGATSVHLHYFSPLSKGLFHRGISQSGTALAPRSIHKAPLDRTNRLAISTGCDSLSSEEIVKCLKQRPAKQLVQNSHDSSIAGFPLTPFAPVVEQVSNGSFLADYPSVLLKSGNVADVPWITGSTTEEGILGVSTLRFRYDKLNENWNTVLPYVLNYEYTADESNRFEIAHKIKQFYLNGNNVNENNVQSLIKLFGDRYFYLSLEESARLQSKVVRSAIYTYIYGYKEDAKLDELLGMKESYGVNHGNDGYLLYIVRFGDVILSRGKLSESDEKIKELMLDLVTSFAKDGNPISDEITWKPVRNSSNFNYLSLRNDEIEMVSKNELAPTEFWRTLPINKYNSKS